MRLILTLALLFLTACQSVSDGTDIRAVKTDAERQEYYRHADHVDRAYDRLISANAEYCSPKCRFRVVLGPASGLGAFTNSRVSPPEIWVTFPLMRFLENDDEIALLIAHEWSHILLGHAAVYDTLGGKTAELQADCLGAILAARAGYDVSKAALSLKRMGNTATGIIHTMTGGNTHPPFTQRYELTVDIGGRGRNIDKNTANQICGVRL